MAYISSRFFRPCEPGIDVSESNSVRSNTKLRTPFLRHRLGQACDSGLCQTIVRLASVPVRARSAANIDDASGLSILDSEVWRSRPYQPEGSSCVYCKNSVPLLVRHLVDNTIPGIARIVYDVVDLPTPKLHSFLDEDIEISLVCYVARNGDGAIRGVIVDLFSNSVRLC